MEKKALMDYIDACAIIKKTERDIRALQKRKKIVQDKVKGSNPEFPYEAKSFNISGTEETVEDASKLAQKEETLLERKRIAEELKMQVDEWMISIPFRMQRIITYRVFEGMEWEDVAKELGRRSTGEGIRKEYERFLK